MLWRQFVIPKLSPRRKAQINGKAEGSHLSCKRRAVIICQGHNPSRLVMQETRGAMDRDEFIRAFQRCLEDTGLGFFFDISENPYKDVFLYISDDGGLFFSGVKAPFDLDSVRAVHWRRRQDDWLTDSIIISFGFGSFQMTLNEVRCTSQYAFQCWRPYMEPIYYSAFSSELLSDVFLEAGRALARSAEEFETMEFGEYPYYEDGGKQPISWLVLERGEEGVLLLAKDVIDVKPMYEMNDWIHRDRKVVTDYWADSDLRQWLNRVFLLEAFSNGERERIAACPDGTGDPVFLLSESELEEHIPAFPIFGKDRKAALTPYAKTKKPGSVVANTCAWWIRSYHANDYGTDMYPEVCDPSSYEYSVTACCVADSRHGVRPAIWIMA